MQNEMNTLQYQSSLSYYQTCTEKISSTDISGAFFCIFFSTSHEICIFLFLALSILGKMIIVILFNKYLYFPN